jgi:uridine nucleosidase
VKVHSGAAKPIVRDAVHAADIHGESGLDGVTLLPQPTEPAVTDVDYLEAMYNALIATPPNTAWLVSTGTLTNVGLLFQKYTDLAGHLKGLSIMGGAVGGGFTDAPMGKVKGEGERFGNWTAYAEFNVSSQLVSQVSSRFLANLCLDLRERTCLLGLQRD